MLLLDIAVAWVLMIVFLFLNFDAGCVGGLSLIVAVCLFCWFNWVWVWKGVGVSVRIVWLRLLVVLVSVGLVFISFVYVWLCVTFVLYWLLVLGFDFLLFVLLGVFYGYLGWFCCLLIAVICLFVRYGCLLFAYDCGLLELVMFYTLMSFLGRCLRYWF